MCSRYGVQHQVQRLAGTVGQRQPVGLALVADPLRATAPGSGCRRTPGYGRAAWRNGRRASPRTPAVPRRPRPSRKRPSDRVSSVAAVIAVMAGVRAGICMIALPTSIVVGLRGEPRQHAHRVRAVGLRDPHDREPETFRLLDEGDVLRRIAAHPPVTDVESQTHWATLASSLPGPCRGEPVVSSTVEQRRVGRSGLTVSRLGAGHHDLGHGDRSGRGRGPAGRLPRRRRHARRHRRLLRHGAGRGHPRRPDRRRRAAQRARDRQQGRHPAHRGGPVRRLLPRGAAAASSTTRCASSPPSTWTSGTCTTSTTRCRSRRRSSALDHAVTSGKVRYVGVSNYSGWRLGRAATWQRSVPGRAPVVANQVRYSLVDRGIEREVVPACEALGVGIFPWSPLGGRRCSPASTAAASRPTRARRCRSRASLVDIDDPGAAGIVEAVATAAEGLATSPVTVALAWLRDRPGVAAPILGARTLGQLTGAARQRGRRAAARDPGRARRRVRARPCPIPRTCADGDAGSGLRRLLRGGPVAGARAAARGRAGRGRHPRPRRRQHRHPDRAGPGERPARRPAAVVVHRGRPGLRGRRAGRARRRRRAGRRPRRRPAGPAGLPPAARRPVAAARRLRRDPGRGRPGGPGGDPGRHARRPATGPGAGRPGCWPGRPATGTPSTSVRTWRRRWPSSAPATRRPPSTPPSTRPRSSSTSRTTPVPTLVPRLMPTRTPTREAGTADPQLALARYAEAEDGIAQGVARLVATAEAVQVSTRGRAGSALKTLDDAPAGRRPRRAQRRGHAC